MEVQIQDFDGRTEEHRWVHIAVLGAPATSHSREGPEGGHVDAVHVVPELQLAAPPGAVLHRRDEQAAARRQHLSALAQAAVAHGQHRGEHVLKEQEVSHPLAHDDVHAVRLELQILGLALPDVDDAVGSVRGRYLSQEVREPRRLDGHHAPGPRTRGEDSEQARARADVHHRRVPMLLPRRAKVLDGLPVRLDPGSVLEHLLMYGQVRVGFEVRLVVLAARVLLGDRLGPALQKLREGRRVPRKAADHLLELGAEPREPQVRLVVVVGHRAPN
mmetsp:Transcript_81355/g.226563  ORF Transcript_81355/g.226563 Transcript_81355/m.226563 type:complete len:274 (+) Transcript_81355:386-1207(+)